MKNLTMTWVGVACSLALSACSGGSEAVPASITLFKELFSIQCSDNNPVPDEVKLISDAGLNPVNRRCNHVFPDSAHIAACGAPAYFAYSVLTVLPSEVAKANSIGYAEQLRATQTYDPANDFPCD